MAGPNGDINEATLPDPFQHWIIAAIALTIVLLWPAWYNGQPILFPDSIGYERAGAVTLAVTHVVEEPGSTVRTQGKNAIDQGGDGVSTVRSPYYGVPLTLAVDIGGIWAVAVLQALGVVTALLMALRRLRVPLPAAVATVSALALFCGLAVYADALMPDVFAGLMLLGFAMLLAVPQLPRTERLLWLLAIVVAMLFHKAFLATGIALTAGAAVFAWRLRLSRTIVVQLAACCTIGVFGHVLVDVCVRQISGRAPIGVPFLLARYAGSPVLGDYLRDHCAPPRFIICRYRSRLPMAPDEFLWGKHGVYIAVPVADRQAIAEQANTVLRGAVAARPAAAVTEAVRGSITQLFTVGMGDFALGIPRSTVIDGRLAPAMATYPDSAIARRTFPLYPLGLLALGLYLGGAAAVLAALIAGRRDLRSLVPNGRPRLAILLAVIVAGVVTNAIVSGILSGVFERYQGRIAWLMPFGAVVVWQAQRRRLGAAKLAVN